MKTPCKDVQQKLIENAFQSLSEEERGHLHACKECHELARDVYTVGNSLSVVARQIDAQDAHPLPADLKNRVRMKFQDHPAQQESWSGNGSNKRVKDVRKSFAERVPEFFSLAAFRRSGLIWAAAAAVMLAVFGVGVYQTHEQSPAARLDFTSGLVSAFQADVEMRHEGLGEWHFKKGSKIETFQNSMCLMTIGESSRGALANATEIDILSNNCLQLNRGSIWLSVNPDGRGFEVQTPHGLVRVTGTLFGVTATETQTMVEVAEGAVEVARNTADQRVMVPSGKTLSINVAEFGDLSTRIGGDAPPEWVESLIAKEKAAHDAEYIPSLKRDE